MNKPDVEVKLARYGTQVTYPYIAPSPVGQFYLASDVDSLLESKEKRIRELEEGLRGFLVWPGRLLEIKNMGERIDDAYPLAEDDWCGALADLDTMEEKREAARTLLSEEKPL